MPSRKTRQAGGQDPNRLRRASDRYLRIAPAHEPGDKQADPKSQKNRHPAQAGQRIAVQVPFLAGVRYPAVGDRNISNISGQDKRQKQGEPENAEIQNSQLKPLGQMLVLASLLTERVADWIGLQRDRAETRYSIREEREIRCLLDA